MTTTRREFLDRLAAGGLVLGGLPLALGAAPSRLEASPAIRGTQGTWDTSWPARLAGRVRVVYDIPEVDSGYGIWRASFWARQYEETMGVPARETSTAVVLRHNGIALAMQQAYWDRYGIGKRKGVMHPLTGEPLARNPALLGAADGLPEPFSTFALPQFITRGGIALACALALQECVALIAQEEQGDEAEAARRARALMIPGVILQPSGVFAAILAQQVAGAHYIHSD
jgi:hypothetical protein